MSEQHIVSEIQDAIMTIRLNRADKKNALLSSMYADMTAALQQAAADGSVRVVLLTGSGDSFCSGNDLADFLENTPTDVASAPVMKFMVQLAQFPKPVVAAVNGMAIGIGVTLLAHCDLVYAAPGLRFAYPFVNIGICPEFGSTLLVPAMMGHQKASELLLLGEPFTSEKACEAGLINAVIPADTLLAHAMERARKLAAQPPAALRTSKALLKRWPQAQLAEAIRVEAEHFMPMLQMPEALEAMGAFMEKRKPDFSKFS